MKIVSAGIEFDNIGRSALIRACHRGASDKQTNSLPPLYSNRSFFIILESFRSWFVLGSLFVPCLNGEDVIVTVASWAMATRVGAPRLPLLQPCLAAKGG